MKIQSAIVVLIISSTLLFGNAGDLKWKSQLNDVIDWSSPCVYNGLVFIADIAGYVYGVNVADGSVKWSYKTAKRIESNPSVFNEILYIGGNDMNMHAFNANTGALLWSNPYSGQIQTEAQFYKGSLYFGALDSTFYSTNWTFKTGDVIYSSPAFKDSLVFFGSYDTYVYGLNASNGNLVWKTQTFSRLYAPIQSSATVLDSIVYISNAITSGAGQICALRCTDGSMKWQTELGDFIFSQACTLDDSLVYVGVSGGNNHFCCVRIVDGKTKWSREDNAAAYFSSPCAKDGVVYVGLGTNYFLALNAYTGEVNWRYTTGNGVYSSPCIANDIVYFGSRDSCLYACHITDTGFKNKSSSKDIPSRLQAYPNPFSDRLNLDLPAQSSVYSITGQLIMRLEKGKHNIDTRKWMKGIYFIQCECRTGIRIVKID